MTLEYEQWREQYQPIKNSLVKDSPYDGCMFETQGMEMDYVRTNDTCFIWTLVDCDYEDQYILPGLHIINRVGYFITHTPWTNENLEVNVNEMIAVGKAKYLCMEFLEELGIPEDLYEDKIHDWFNHNT